MNKQTHFWILNALLLPVVVSFGACATGHAAHHAYLMKGSIVETSAEGVTICAGKKDGAAVGQELSVYHILRLKNASFSKQKVGIIKITQVFDEHFAKATVASGKAEMGDIVELE
ncbi:MAG: hypothetical protein JNM27_13860 [Leptospirales bacterium]|nr:hypothetical protein [Leptospirales bacterium]